MRGTTTARLFRDLLLVPGIVAATSIMNWKGVQEAREVDKLALKEELNHNFSDNVSAMVIFGTLFAVHQMIESLGDEGWNKLSHKERLIYSLMMLVAATGFGYSMVQIFLDNTNTLLVGKGLPTAAGLLLSGIANNGVKLLTAGRVEYDDIEVGPQALRI